MIESAQARYGEISPSFPKADRVRIEFYAEVVDWRELRSLKDAERLRGQHIWRDEVIAERFESGRKKEIYAMAVRVWRLGDAYELPMRKSYGGCKSWIELEEEVSTERARAVLTEGQFEQRLKEFRSALAGLNRYDRGSGGPDFWPWQSLEKVFYFRSEVAKTAAARSVRSPRRPQDDTDIHILIYDA